MNWPKTNFRTDLNTTGSGKIKCDECGRPARWVVDTDDPSYYLRCDDHLHSVAELERNFRFVDHNAGGYVVDGDEVVADMRWMRERSTT